MSSADPKNKSKSQNRYGPNNPTINLNPGDESINKKGIIRASDFNDQEMPR